MRSQNLEKIRQELPGLLPRLWRFALVLCRDRDFAQDLVQSACVRALERAEQFEQGTHLDRWVFSIMASIWNNEIDRRRVRIGNGIVDVEAVVSNQFLEEMEVSMTVKQIVSAIAGLPDQQRIIAMLVYVEGMTFAEAAKALNAPISTLLNRMVVVRASLTEKFATQTAATTGVHD